MTARFVDALKGYEFFLARRGKPSRKEINSHLESIGRRPISERTYSHYQKLLDQGFRGYIPINKFDVFQSLGRIQLAADRRRYERRDVAQPAKISKSGDNWHDVTLVDRSIVGFGIHSPSKYHISPGTRLLISLKGYRQVPVVVVWREHIDEGTRMGLRAFEFVAKYRLQPEEIEPRRTGSLRIRRRNDAELDWANFFRVLEKTDELLEAAEDLILSIDDLVKSGIVLANPTVVSISFSSPGEADLKVDLGVAEALDVILSKAQFWGEQKRRYGAETDQIELQNVNLRLEVIRNAIQTKKVLEEQGVSQEIIEELLGPPLQKALGVEALPDNLFEDGSPELAILNQRLLPAAAELNAGDDLDFEIDIPEEEQEANG